MSATLYWEPIVCRGESLGDKLKFILRERYQLTEGVATLTSDDVGYLRGLADAGITDAAQLIEAIEKHGHIRIWLEY
jgi:hypothetical protein